MTIIESGWRRVELVPMDEHCSDIAVALYRRDSASGPVGLVHTYSSRPGAAERVAFLTEAVVAMGGLEAVAGDPQLVRFPCGEWHQAASKRLLLEVAKLESGAPLGPLPLEIHDKKSGQQIRVEPLGSGEYRVVAEDVEPDATSRAPAVAGGLAKLAELVVGEDTTLVRFPCGHDHDALVGLLLRRALNVRAVLREEEAIASRGVLAAPSAQESA